MTANVALSTFSHQPIYGSSLFKHHRASRYDMNRHGAMLPFAGGEHARPKAPTNTTRANDDGRESYCTPAAKSKLMKQIRDEGLPEYISASTHARCRRKGVGAFMQQVESDSVHGGVVTVPMQRPAAMLSHVAYTCAPFAALLHTAIAKSENIYILTRMQTRSKPPTH